MKGRIHRRVLHQFVYKEEAGLGEEWAGLRR